MGWSPREVLAFDDATLAAAVSEAREVAGWLPVPELLSLIFERVDALFVAFVHANSPKRPPMGLKPTRLPRPGDADRAKRPGRRLSWSEFAAAAERGGA